jgi:hypothetical protein
LLGATGKSLRFRCLSTILSYIQTPSPNQESLSKNIPNRGVTYSGFMDYIE